MRKRSILISLFLVVALVIALSIPGLAAAESANLVKNPGFEQLTNNFPTDWKVNESSPANDQVKVEVSNQAPHSGSNCLKIENADLRDTMVIQTVDLKKDKVYKVSCWIRTENILNQAGSANITLYYDNNGVDGKGIITSTEFQNTNNQWTLLELKFQSLKVNYPFYLGIRLGGQGTVNQGIAYFDDISIQESDDSGQLSTFFIPGANNSSSSNNNGTPGSGPNKVIIYVILGILAIAILVFMESKLGKRGKKDQNAEDEEEEEAEAEDETDEEESEDDEIQDDKGKKK